LFLFVFGNWVYNGIQDIFFVQCTLTEVIIENAKSALIKRK